ncbi:MAG: hypothetical protein ACQEP1_04315, partial [Nanobdellota archaeon]
KDKIESGELKDSDGDDVPDSIEQQLNLDPNKKDSDDDGVSDKNDLTTKDSEFEISGEEDSTSEITVTDDKINFKNDKTEVKLGNLVETDSKEVSFKPKAPGYEVKAKEGKHDINKIPEYTEKVKGDNVRYKLSLDNGLIYAEFDGYYEYLYHQQPSYHFSSFYDEDSIARRSEQEEWIDFSDSYLADKTFAQSFRIKGDLKLNIDKPNYRTDEEPYVSMIEHELIVNEPFTFRKINFNMLVDSKEYKNRIFSAIERKDDKFYDVVQMNNGNINITLDNNNVRVKNITYNQSCGEGKALIINQNELYLEERCEPKLTTYADITENNGPFAINGFYKARGEPKLEFKERKLLQREQTLSDSTTEIVARESPDYEKVSRIRRLYMDWVDRRVCYND